MTQKVINFFAGPGAGKSTTATGVFSLLKMHGLNVEYVSEVAKDLAWEGALDNASFLDIMGKQVARMERLRGKVDYIISDSPLLMQAAYSSSKLNKDIAKAEFDKWDNINWYVLRDKPFNPLGRNHNEHEALHLDSIIEKLLAENYYKSMVIYGNFRGINTVVKRLVEQRIYLTDMETN